MMKKSIFMVVVAGVLAAVLGLVAGCASTPESPSKAPLVIDGQTPDAILGSEEVSRIDRRIPDVYRQAVQRAEAFGRTIYAYNELARHAGKLVVPDGRSPFSYPPAGWITQHVPEGLRLSFIVKEQQKIGIAAEVIQTPNGLETHHFSPPNGLSPGQLALWRARDTAYEKRFKPCSPHYRPAVMPVSIEGASFIYAFLLPVSSNAKTLFLGGYQRAVISSNGRVILESHEFTHDCITLHRRSDNAAARVTEVVSDTPTAPQVYASLRYDLSIHVKTLGNGLSWQVKKGRITLLSKGQNKSGKSND